MEIFFEKVFICTCAGVFFYLQVSGTMKSLFHIADWLPTIVQGVAGGQVSFLKIAILENIFWTNCFENTLL